VNIVLRLLLWLIRRYGVSIAVSTLIWMGFEIGESVIQGVTDTLGEAAAREVKRAVAKPDKPQKPSADVVAAINEFLAMAPPTNEGPWKSPDQEAAEMVVQECAAWIEFEKLLNGGCNNEHRRARYC